MIDPFDAIRVLNIALAVYVLIQAARAIDWWKTQPTQTRFLLMGMLAMVAATGWAFAEGIVLDLPRGPRVLIYTPALAWCAIGITLTHHRKARP
ncbi:hypothetical protein BRM3_08845 [Brachybacterium huguangmaarense]|uniref:Uncharacterized protein n=1 Tax=Brachybacterium huguangmaarense TaxID=1652028 RepID=A0ABY6FZE0_9MICO|nr:hypothetical protein [Brachybacterium huguangmaarense]UYG15751.1 hypothetical protein BRM3_08845 [Brachybacterium huguangmaarense]